MSGGPTRGNGRYYRNKTEHPALSEREAMSGRKIVQTCYRPEKPCGRFPAITRRPYNEMCSINVICICSTQGTYSSMGAKVLTPPRHFAAASYALLRQTPSARRPAPMSKDRCWRDMEVHRSK